MNRKINFAQIWRPVWRPGLICWVVGAAGGVFTARLNFGSSQRGRSSLGFMEIDVKPSSNPDDPFTSLTSRQPITDE